MRAELVRALDDPWFTAVGRPHKPKRELGWVCTLNFHDLIIKMTRSDSLRESGRGHE